MGRQTCNRREPRLLTTLPNSFLTNISFDKHFYWRLKCHLGVPLLFILSIFRKYSFNLLFILSIFWKYFIKLLSREEEEGVVLGPLGLHARFRLDFKHKIRIFTNSFKKYYFTNDRNLSNSHLEGVLLLFWSDLHRHIWGKGLPCKQVFFWAIW